MRAADFDAGNEREALSLPDIIADASRVAGPPVRADYMKGRAGTCHDNRRRAGADERCPAYGVQVDADGARDAIIAFWEIHRASGGFDSRLDCGGIIGLAVALGPEILDRRTSRGNRSNRR